MRSDRLCLQQEQHTALPSHYSRGRNKFLKSIRESKRFPETPNHFASQNEELAEAVNQSTITVVAEA